MAEKYVYDGTVLIITFIAVLGYLVYYLLAFADGKNKKKGSKNKDEVEDLRGNKTSQFFNRDFVTEDELKKYASVSEDARILMSIKGISALTAMTILSAIDGIYRFETPESLVSYFGLAVTHKESARKMSKVGSITKEGDPLVRKYMANVITNHSTRCPDSDLSRFYRSKKESMPHWKAVTAAMRKLTCIICAMLSKKEQYRFHPN